eukprot:jgi/Tetstr1/438498/TSEL_027053.t1
MGPATAQHATTAGATRSPTALSRQLGQPQAQCHRPSTRGGCGALRKWGDTSEGYGSRFTGRDLSLVFETAISMGCTFFDCDETYGYQSLPAGQQAEQLLGRQKALWWSLVPALARIPAWSAWAPKRADLWADTYPVDARNAEFMEGLADAVEMGLVRAVGVSNFKHSSWRTQSRRWASEGSR